MKAGVNRSKRRQIGLFSLMLISDDENGNVECQQITFTNFSGVCYTDVSVIVLERSLGNLLSCSAELEQKDGRLYNH